MKSAWRWLGLICGGALIVAPLRAADDPVDPEFLEFLGSVDSSEAGWHEYLAATDVDQVANTQSGAPKSADPGSPAPANGKGKVGQQ